MGVIIVFLWLVVIGLVGVVVHLWFMLRGRDEQVHFLMNEAASQDRLILDQEIDLEMAHFVIGELKVENRNHLRCLTMVLEEVR